MRIQEGYLTRKSGSWMGHYSQWHENASTGEKKRLQRAFVIGSVSGMSKMEARQRLRSRIEQEKQDRPLPTESPVKPATLSWFIENRWQPLREGTWRGNTKATNEYIFSHIKKRFGDMLLQDIDAVLMQTWLNALSENYSGSLVRHVRHYLKSIFLEAVEQDYIRKSPARLLRLPNLMPVAKPFLSQQEIRQLLKIATGRDRLLLRIVFATALRPSELFALRWRSFDSRRRLLHIKESVYRGKVRAFTKTTDERSDERLQRVFLPGLLVKELQTWQKNRPDDAFIFPSENGTPITKENYRNRVLHTLAKKAGISKLNFQILRRSVATHMQSLGSPQDIAGVMRHRRPNTAAEHYVQVIPESVRKTTERLFARIL